jgi:hypothetical protein
VTALRALVVARTGDAARLRTLLVLAAMAAAAVGSILYFPDVIHLAFVGPLFAIVAAELVEWTFATGGARMPRLARAAVWVIAAIVVVAVGSRAGNFLAESRRAFAFPAETRFGRVDFHDPHDVALVDRIRRLADATPSRELFVYPSQALLYLATGTTNPTRYQLLLPGYSGAEQIAEAVSTLEARRVPYVVLVAPFVGPRDPVAAYVRERYERVSDPEDETATRMELYRRRAERAGG